MGTRNGSNHTDRASDLAGRLLQDIRLRGLSEGDRYLSTDEVGKAFRVRRATVNLAMRLLADRQVLVRTPGRGTYVGAQATETATSRVHTLYMVIAADRPMPAPVDDQAIALLRQELPGVDLHFSFLPAHRPVDYARELVRTAIAARDAVGFLLLSCPAEVYRFFVDCSLPVVVVGHVYRDSLALPSIDSDMRHAGWLMVNHLVESGHRKIALLTLANWRAGDNMLFEGITQRLAEANLPADALIVRSLPHDLRGFAGEALALAERPERPSAIICRNRAQADAIREALAGKGLSVPNDLAVVFGVEGANQVSDCPLPFVRPRPTWDGQMAMGSQMIRRMVAGEDCRGTCLRVPVELALPAALKTATESSPSHGHRGDES